MTEDREGVENKLLDQNAITDSDENLDKSIL